MWFIERRRRRAVARARAALAAWGHDLSGYTDEEVERGLLRVGDGLAHLGFSAAEARESIEAVARLRRGSD